MPEIRISSPCQSVTEDCEFGYKTGRSAAISGRRNVRYNCLSELSREIPNLGSALGVIPKCDISSVARWMRDLRLPMFPRQHLLHQLVQDRAACRASGYVKTLSPAALSITSGSVKI